MSTQSNDDNGLIDSIDPARLKLLEKYATAVRTTPSARQVGSRHEPQLSGAPTGALLKEGALFAETFIAFHTSTYIPKGVYRFKTHDEANRHQMESLAIGLGLRAAGRT